MKLDTFRETVCGCARARLPYVIMLPCGFSVPGRVADQQKNAGSGFTLYYYYICILLIICDI